ncbi:MAG TPA: hypothetical protein VJA26_12760 [Gammaproteobacteria bacterium]|nr:hypothetical protein [Gammaproteobacteria bacterium]
MNFALGGQAEVPLVESALDKMNVHFDGAEFNSAFSFAVSYLASLIVVYEQYVLEGREQFNFGGFADELREAVKAGHGLPVRKPQ